MHDIGDGAPGEHRRSWVSVADLGAGVAVVRLERVEKRNAIDLDLVRGLRRALDDVDTPVVVLASADPACFCAGVDRSITANDRRVVSDLLYEIYELMIGHRSMIVAAVGGHAIGGGAQLALASDLRIAASDARFRFLGPGHGLAVGAWALPAVVGRGRALEITASMRPVLAEEAYRIGLVNAIVPDAMDGAVHWARDLAGSDPAALSRVKAVTAVGGELLAALHLEREANRAAWSGVL